MHMFIVQMHQVSKLHWVSKTKWFKIPFSLQWKNLEASTFTQGTQGSGNELLWTTYQLTNPVNTFLLTAIFLHKALTSTTHNSLKLYFDFQLESLSYERWFRMNSHANDNDFLSRHVSVLKQHKLITLIGEVFPEAEIAKTYCLHSLLVNACP